MQSYKMTYLQIRRCFALFHYNTTLHHLNLQSQISKNQTDIQSKYLNYSVSRTTIGCLSIRKTGTAGILHWLSGACNSQLPFPKIGDSSASRVTSFRTISDFTSNWLHLSVLWVFCVLREMLNVYLYSWLLSREKKSNNIQSFFFFITSHFIFKNLYFEKEQKVSLKGHLLS